MNQFAQLSLVATSISKAGAALGPLVGRAGDAQALLVLHLAAGASGVLLIAAVSTVGSKAGAKAASRVGGGVRDLTDRAIREHERYVCYRGTKKGTYKQ